jgi:type III secretory pathway component EscR
VAVCGRLACCALRFLNKFDTVHSFSLNILFFVVAMGRSMLKCIVLSVRTPQARALSIQTAPAKPSLMALSLRLVFRPSE